jgi:hypothetical protein
MNNHHYLTTLCHHVLAAYDRGGNDLRSAIESLRIAMTGKTKHEYANDLDNTPVTFGKYKGHTPEEISVVDPGYIVWMFDNIKPAKCSKELRDGCEWELRESQAESEFDRQSERFQCAEDF